MSGLRLYFGPQNRYFLADENNSQFRFRATQSFVDFFNSAGVAGISSVAFGESDSYFLAWRLQNGQGFLRYDYGGTSDPYPKFRKFIFEEGPHDVASVEASLGMNGSFFIRSNKGQRWHNVAEGAIDYYQKFTTPALFQTKRVQCIDMCYGDAYLGIGVDNTWFWDLSDSYPQFSTNVIKPGKMTQAAFVHLNPFAPDQHFIRFNDGSVQFSVPQEWAIDMAQFIRTYAGRPQRMMGSPHSPPPLHATNYFARPFSVSAEPQQPTSPTYTNSQGIIHLGHSAYDAYNNITNAISPNQGGGGMPDISQSVDTINDMLSATNSMNNLAQTALNGGQFAGQIATLATGCNVM